MAIPRAHFCGSPALLIGNHLALDPPPLDLLGIEVQPLDLHLVNVGSIPTGPMHDEGRLQPHPGDVLKSTPNVWKNLRLESGEEAERSRNF